MKSLKGPLSLETNQLCDVWPTYAWALQNGSGGEHASQRGRKTFVPRIFAKESRKIDHSYCSAGMSILAFAKMCLDSIGAWCGGSISNQITPLHYAQTQLPHVLRENIDGNIFTAMVGSIFRMGYPRFAS